MMESLLNFKHFSPYLSTIIEFVVVFLVFLSINLVKNAILKKAQLRLSTSPNIWDDAVVSAAIWPSSILILLLFISYSLKIIGKSFPEQILLSDANYYIKTIGIIVIISWFSMSLVSRLEHNYFRIIDKDTTLDSASSYLLGKIVRALIFIVAVVVSLQTLGYSLTGLLTVGGAGSIIIGIAAQDMLANFFGGLMVYLDKPFKVGDWVKNDNNKLEGTVEKIGWRSTRMRNLEKRPVYVPNKIWTGTAVENVTRMSNRRVKEMIGVRYQDSEKLDNILKDILSMLEEHEGVDHRQNVIVRFTEFGPSSLNFMLYFFTKSTKLKDFLEIKENIYFQVIKIVHKHKADFAFPTTTLDIPKESLAQLSKL